MNPHGSHSAAFEQAVVNFEERFKDQLSKPILEQFRRTSLDDLEHSLNAIQESQTKPRKLRAMVRLSKFLEAMKSLDEVVHVLLNSTKYLGFVWGELHSSNHLNGWPSVATAPIAAVKDIPRSSFYDLQRMLRLDLQAP